MVKDMGKPGYEGFLNNKCVTMGEVMQEAGYTTMISGKWHLGSNETHWPEKRGFEKYYAVPQGGGVYFAPFLKERAVIYNGEKVDLDSNFYTTDAFNDHAAQFIREQQDSTQPFFMYLAHIAPHFPLQAFPEDIAKYRGKYKEGFAKIKQARFEKMKAMSLLPEGQNLAPADDMVDEWGKLSEEEKDMYDKKMAIYAAQVECLDRGLGRVFDALKETGQYENTLIIFLSDNGNTHEKIEKGDNSLASIGTRESYATISRSWTNVSNTPFRMYKHWVHEGGISTPFIAHWKAKELQGTHHTPWHITDLMPTFIDMAETSYPETYQRE